MKRIKEMKIEVTSEITELDVSGNPEGKPEQTRECSSAFLHLSDEGMLITYISESEDGKTSTDIEIESGRVTVKRRGDVKSCFVFEEGVTHTSLYSVGAYSFDASISTRRIRQGIDDGGGTLDLYYTMTIGGAGKSVRMRIRLTPVG